jgi:hypothetical protein
VAYRQRKIRHVTIESVLVTACFGILTVVLFVVG